MCVLAALKYVGDRNVQELVKKKKGCLASIISLKTKEQFFHQLCSIKIQESFGYSKVVVATRGFVRVCQCSFHKGMACTRGLSVGLGNAQLI